MSSERKRSKGPAAEDQEESRRSKKQRLEESSSLSEQEISVHARLDEDDFLHSPAPASESGERGGTVGTTRKVGNNSGLFVSFTVVSSRERTLINAHLVSYRMYSAQYQKPPALFVYRLYRLYRWYWPTGIGISVVCVLSQSTVILRLFNTPMLRL